ncbi:MAG: ABC transporter substrate-binding protein [Devosiaceae bacterium]
MISAANAEEHVPQRIVSLNMCTDQLVLALADREQIVGLSRFAASERLSFAASQALSYPLLPAAAEAVIALGPDLVLAGRFTNRAAKDMLARFQYRVEEVPFVRSLEDARAAIRLVATLVGHADRGEALIVQIDNAIAEAVSDSLMSALIIQRRGYATGTASLTADLLAELGITLASEDLVGARGGFADLETVIRAQPDVLITSSLHIDGEDQGTALLVHPALDQRYPPARRLALPERLTLCAGPSLIEAARHIARERDAALRRLAGG